MASGWRDDDPHCWTTPNPHLGLVDFWGPYERDVMENLCLGFSIGFPFDPDRLSHPEDQKMENFPRSSALLE